MKGSSSQMEINNKHRINHVFSSSNGTSLPCQRHKSILTLELISFHPLSGYFVSQVFGDLDMTMVELT